MSQTATTSAPGILVIREHELGFYAWVSIAVHLVAIIILLIFTFWVNPLMKTAHKLTIVESAVRVDLVAMPRMTVQELQNVNPVQTAPELTPEQKAALEQTKEAPPAPSDSETEYLKTQKQKSFLDMIKTLSKKDVQKNVGKGMKGELQQLILAGNKLSQGSAVVGHGTPGEGSDFNNYVGALPDIVRPFWKLPNYLMNQNLRCRIRLYLSATGQLLKTEIFESSGNDDYDLRAQSAVREASPFPELPKEARDRAVKGDIVLGFPL